MPVVNYHSANGRLIGETTSGVRTDYMSDALGSVTGTLNASQAVVNTYRYKPYGELLAKTGSAADPSFMWNGTTQSRRTGLTFSDQYNRARHYGTRQGQWTTVDPLWPRERAYAYVMGRPVVLKDPLGLTPMDISIRSFIHKDEDIARGVSVSGFSGTWLPGFLNVAYIKGDHRKHFEKGTSRVKARMAFDSCDIGSLSNGNTLFEAYSDITETIFWDDWPLLQLATGTATPDISLKVISNKCDATTNNASTFLLARYSAPNPTIPFSPPIKFGFYLRLSRSSEGYVELSMFGTHTQYPWHEAEMNIGKVHKRLYKYSATVGNLPWGLLDTTRFSCSSGGPGERCCCS
jgi:RHS repeat-associated protein